MSRFQTEESWLEEMTDHLIDQLFDDPAEIEAILDAADPKAALDDFADAFDWIPRYNEEDALVRLAEIYAEGSVETAAES